MVKKGPPTCGTLHLICLHFFVPGPRTMQSDDELFPIAVLMDELKVGQP